MQRTALQLIALISAVLLLTSVATSAAVIEVSPTDQVLDTTSGPAMGSVDVYIDPGLGQTINLTAYTAQLTLPTAAGIAFTGVAPVPAGIDAAFANGGSPNTFGLIGEQLGVADDLPAGFAVISDKHALFRANFTIAQGTTGTFNINFNSIFSSLSDDQGNIIPVTAVTGGTVTAVTPEPSTAAITLAMLAATSARRRKTA